MKIKSILCLVLFAAYAPVLTSHQTVDPDAQIILKNLSDMQGPTHYFQELFQLKTIDFQPVRDASLAIDLLMFKYLHFNSFVLQNILWWIASLFIVFRISKLILPESQTWNRLLSILALGVYPLFSGVISWGMNRKHLIALFFILYATRLVIEKRQKLAPLFYFLSVLSQPIHLLWPAWAALYLRRKNANAFYLILGVLFVILALANTIYYKYSPTYRYFYPDKMMELWNFSDRILAIGHYTFQLFFPYILSYKYDLGHWSTLVGLLLLVLFSYFLYKKKLSNISHWIVLGILPLFVVLMDPFVLSDAYLLLSAISIFFVVIQLTGMIRAKYLLPVILIWTVITFIESSNWTDRVKLAEVGFVRRPSCLSAVNYVKVTYDSFQRSPEGIRYIEENDCIKKMHVTPFFYLTMNIFFAHYYFHEDYIPTKYRLERLMMLKAKHHFIHLSLIGLLIKEKSMEEAKYEAEAFGDIWKDIPITPGYHEITARFVHPFCVEKKIASCEAITSKLIVKPKRPNL